MSANRTHKCLADSLLFEFYMINSSCTDINCAAGTERRMCLNGGTCSRVPETLPDLYACECPQGFAGAACGIYSRLGYVCVNFQ